MNDISNVENETSVFSLIRSHMLEGLMFHDQMYNAFLFLRLYKFAKDHKKHYKEENKSFKKLNKYYITHRNKLIEETKLDFSNSVIQPEMYKKTRFDVTDDDIRNYVAYLMDLWVDWERKSKELYTEGYNKLIEYGFAPESEIIMDLVKDVDDELAEAESLQLELEAMKYDVIEIMKMNE